MDSTTEKSCLEEISTLVLDANEKVSLKTISNNWNVPNDIANKVLLKWFGQNQKKVENLMADFVVRGKDKTGNHHISVVSNETKDALQTKWTDFCSMLYSVESRNNTRKLDIPDHEPIKVKNILLESKAPRDLHIPDISVVKQEPTVSKKVEPAKAKNPFNVMKPAIKPEVKKDLVIEVKKEVKSPEKKTSPPKQAVVVKSEKKSPEDGKTAKDATNKKVQLKNQKPVQKGSISSFFSNKSGPSKPAVEKPKTIPVAAKKEELKKDVEPTKSRKRSLTTERSPSPVAPKVAVIKKEVDNKKKPAAKKIKLKENPNKRSRIRVVQDSSDEEEEKNESDEPESKFIKFDREFTPDPESSPEESNKSPEKLPPAGPINKHKAKRSVTKRFQTEDGFIRTERVVEEYSASEDENDENRKKNSPQKVKAAAEVKSEGKKSPAPKVKPVAKGKQGNIMSFFSKK